MRRSVIVDAEIDLCFDVDTKDLVEALVASVGKVRAVDLIQRCETEERGIVSLPDDARLLKEQRQDIRAALGEIEAGHLDRGLYMLRMLVAEEHDQQTWEILKSGKHPFLELRRA